MPYGRRSYGRGAYGVAGTDAPTGPQTHALSGALTISVTASGTLDAPSHALSGTTGVTLTFAGDLRTPHPLAGSTGIALTGEVTRVTLTHPLAGGTGVTVTAAAAMAQPSHPLSGTTGVKVTASAHKLTVADATSYTATGNTTAGSSTVTSSPGTFAGSAEDGTVSGPGIPAGTTITSVSSDGSTATLSSPATASSGATLTIVPAVPPLYEIKVGRWIGTTWTVDTAFERANLDYVEQILNEPWAAEFHLHTLDSQAAQLAPDLLGGRREVQIFRDGRCIFWGVPLQARADLEFVRFSCVGLLWYYTRRYFGPVQNNYLSPNEDFEAGLTNWAGVNTTATISTEWRALGTQSVKLVQTTDGQDGYLYRRYTTTTTTQPVFFAVKALCHIKGSGWVGPAYEERGLYVEQQSTPGGAAVGEVKWEPINEHTPRDHHRPVRLETGITVPAGVTRTIEVRLYSPGGTVYWDATAMATEESVGSRVAGDPANIIITRVNRYAQDATQGKSDLNIGTDAAPGTYPTLVRIYQYFDNGNIWDALREYASEGVCDLEVIWNEFDPTTRHIMVWAGGKGTHKAGAPVTLGTNVVTGFSYDVNAGAITTKPRVLGQGEGADREIGEAIDTSLMDGLVLESVDSAPLEAPIDSLRRLADEALAKARNPVRVPQFRLRASDVFGAVYIGDTVPVTANYGYIQEAGASRRVTRLRLEGKDDSVVVGVT